MIILLIILILPISLTQVYAYWQNHNIEYEQQNVVINLGSWTQLFYDGIDLNIWEDEDILNQTVPNDIIFTYDANDGNGKLLYMVRPGETYNPYYHGLPGDGNNLWAYVSLELEWIPNVNYRTNSVVIRDGRYFIANSAYNHNWFVGDPLNSANKPWSEWREIEPISEEHFGYMPNTNIIDYANPNFAYITYI